MTLFITTWQVKMEDNATAEYEQLCSEYEEFLEVWNSLSWVLKKRPSSCGAIQVGGYYVKAHKIISPSSRLVIKYRIDEDKVIVERIKYTR